MVANQLKSAIVLFIVLTALTGIIYPLVVTGIAQGIFHHQAEGSLIASPDDKIIGSSLIGQDFDDPKYFWGRLSATSPAYNASNSSGSNLGPLNPSLLEEIRGRIAALKSVDPDNKAAIPVDLVTSSGSGLDPHISQAAAFYQLARVARVRGISEAAVRKIVDEHTQGRFLKLLGEPVVNVLQLNLALDEYKK